MNTNCTAKDLTESNLYSIKDKLTMLDEKVTLYNQDMAQNIVDIQDFCNELANINGKSSSTSNGIHKEVALEVTEKEEQIAKFTSHQKAESLRLSMELDDMKVSNSEFRALLQICQKKLNDLQNRIGLETPLLKI